MVCSAAGPVLGARNTAVAKTEAAHPPKTLGAVEKTGSRTVWADQGCTGVAQAEGDGERAPAPVFREVSRGRGKSDPGRRNNIKDGSEVRRKETRPRVPALPVLVSQPLLRPQSLLLSVAVRP